MSINLVLGNHASDFFFGTVSEFTMQRRLPCGLTVSTNCMAYMCLWIVRIPLDFLPYLEYTFKSRVSSRLAWIEPNPVIAISEKKISSTAIVFRRIVHWIKLVHKISLLWNFSRANQPLKKYAKLINFLQPIFYLLDQFCFFTNRNATKQKTN